MDGISIDKKTTAKVMFHKRRLTEDQNLFVREGDFIKYSSIFYEIVKTNEPMQLFPDKLTISLRLLLNDKSP